VRYPLVTVVTTALMAMVCGCDDAEAMQAWGEANEQWLSGFLEMPHGAPTQDVFLAVFGALNPEALSAVFRAWTDLSFVIQVIRERTVLSTGKTSREAAYYIGSDESATAASAGAAARRHWGIENQLHWVLDLAFREDEARHRAKNTAQNMTTLRHFALNIVKSDRRRKLGVANSRKRAGWDRNYLVELLTGA